MKKYIWYSSRLSKMPPQEVLHRIKQKYFQIYDEKVCMNRKVLFPDIHTDFKVFPFKNGPVKNFSSDLISSRLLDGLDKVMCFGHSVDINSNINWHLDFKTGKKWPLDFWSKIDIRDGKKIGGAKFVWEVNRLYVLPMLGLAFYKTKDPQYVDKFFNVLSDWVEKNPYGLGVNWTSGIELAVRVSNVIWGLAYIKDHTINQERDDLIHNFLSSHGRHLYRYESKYSSNNNHTIAEAFALFLIGVYFPTIKSATTWECVGKRILEREAKRQLLIDGGSYEYSTTYLSFVFDFFLLFKLVCESRNIEHDLILNDRLEKSCDFILALLDGKGNLANIGDQDSAVLVNFGIDNHQNFESILNTGAVLFNRLDFCRKNFPDVKTKILLGEERVNTFVEENQTTLDDKVKIEVPFCKKFEHSGLSIIKDVVAGREVVFTGNATPLGMPPLYAHGHLDALSFCLNVGGMEFFVDPGTYLYHSGGKWRTFFRSTAAHNTIRIDGENFTDMPGDFMFGKPYKVTKHTLDKGDSGINWAAAHDAYTRLKKPVVHERKVVWKRDNGRFEISDHLQASGEHGVEMFFHFHPKCEVEIDVNKVTVYRGGVTFEIELDHSLEVRPYYGNEDPLLGWYSHSFNHIEKTNTLVCSKKIIGSEKINTTIRCGWL